ncbi:MAG: helix-turn-helix transcriptional regulator [Pirellulales bacterium]
MSVAPYHLPPGVEPAAFDPLELLSGQDLARLFRVTIKCIRNWTADGKLPTPLFLGGRAVRWRRSTIDAFLSRCVGRRPA